MGYEECRKGNRAMNVDEFMEFGDNYYGRNFGYHSKRTSCLFDYANLYNEIPWKCAKSVSMNDKISYWQVIYALSEIAGKYLFQTIMPYADKIPGFHEIFTKDEFGRLYVTFENYKKFALENKKIFKIEKIKKKELNLWLLRL